MSDYSSFYGDSNNGYFRIDKSSHAVFLYEKLYQLNRSVLKNYSFDNALSFASIKYESAKTLDLNCANRNTATNE